MKSRALKIFLVLLIAAALAAGWFWRWMNAGVVPTAAGAEFFVRYPQRQPIEEVFKDLAGRHVIRDPAAAKWWSLLQRKPLSVGIGTYRLAPGMTLDEVFDSLSKPIRQMVRLPEQNWSRRSANLLEKHGVCTAAEYLELVARPQEFKDEVVMKLPESSLEGYLFPDTYDLPPLLGAREVIVRQLRAFERKVWIPLGQPEDLRREVIIGSMVELEAAREEERPIIAGVIANRLARNMPLQIDATILYAKQKWGRLTFKDYKEVNSPYNTYLHKGLPPGPICSPRFTSIKAAVQPEKHDFLYYVALPTGRHLFSSTYEEHLRNIRKSRAEWAKVAKK